MDTNAHSLDFLDRKNYQKDKVCTESAAIIIEDDVFLGVNSINLERVVVGARSGSVVTKSIPSDCIASGNPCRVIKFVFYR